MADKTTICTICDERHLYKQSTDWCIDCEQALCAECKEFHGVPKASKHHTTTPITDYQTLVSTISSVGGYCSDHMGKYQMFCQTHDKRLCQQCIEEHSDCKDVIPLSKLTRNMKTSEAFREAEQCLNDIHENILNIEDKIKEKLKILNDQKESILTEIDLVRQVLNEHLDQIEAVFRKDVSDIEHKARKELETVLIVLKKNKEKNSSSKQQLEDLRKDASNLQIFSALGQISSDINTTEAFFQSIIDNGHLDKIALKFSVNENLSRITDNIKTFGSVSVQKNARDHTLVMQTDHQAQLVGGLSSSIQDIKLKLTRTITTDISDISGCDILPDGKMVFCDYSEKKRLVVTDTDGTQLFDVPLLKHYACDVACISYQIVAVTTGFHTKSRVNIIDISSRKKLKSIPKDYCCYGITSVNGALVYCAQGKGIEMMDVNGENTTTIVDVYLPHWTYIASHNDKLYYTNPSSHTVTCCDLTGNIFWTFTDDTVLCLRGISVDNDARVYIVDNEGESVTVLSGDGHQSRQILTKEDGLDDPIALHYDKIRKQLWVCNFENTCFLFEISK